MNDSTLERTSVPRIAVVGGGISGLAAAHRVCELLPNSKLTLFEAGQRLGGVLETLQLEDFLIERSADSFLTRQPRTVALCQRLGIEKELISPDAQRRRAFIVRNGQLVPVPSGFFLMSPRKLGPLLRSPLLSLLGKLRILAEPFVPRGHLSPDRNFSSPPTPTRDESVASFARRRLGREAFEWLVQPLVSGIYTADPEKLSMAATMSEFLAEERDHGSLFAAARRSGYVNRSKDAVSGARYGLFVTPQMGVGRLVEALTEQLPPGAVQLNSSVADITQVSQRWRVTFESQSGRIPTARSDDGDPFDAVIVATPSYSASEVLQSQDPGLAAELAAIEYAGCNVVSLAFRSDQLGHSLDGFGFVVPRVEGRRLIAASFASQKFPGRAPEGSVLIRTFIGGALRPDLLGLDDDKLRGIALEELRELLQISGRPIVADVARWPRSMPQYHVGHLDRVARIEHFVHSYPTLALAGNAYRGVGIPQCIESGELAAERIVAALS